MGGYSRPFYSLKINPLQNNFLQTGNDLGTKLCLLGAFSCLLLRTYWEQKNLQVVDL